MELMSILYGIPSKIPYFPDCMLLGVLLYLWPEIINIFHKNLAVKNVCRQFFIGILVLFTGPHSQDEHVYHFTTAPGGHHVERQNVSNISWIPSCAHATCTNEIIPSQVRFSRTRIKSGKDL